MENGNGNSQRPNNFSRPNLTPEQKMQRSMRNLSYTGSSGGMGINGSSRLERPANSSSIERKKVGGVVLDLDTIKGANDQKLETRGRRNNVAIVVLVLLLIVSLIYLAVAIVNFVNGKREPNCHYKITGDVNAQWIVENSTKTDFVVKDGVGTDTIYLLDSVLDIHDPDQVSIIITIKVTYKGDDIKIAGLTGTNDRLHQSSEDSGTYIFKGVILGGGKHHMFSGIDFQDAPEDLNSKNITIEITAHITKVASEY